MSAAAVATAGRIAPPPSSSRPLLLLLFLLGLSTHMVHARIEFDRLSKRIVTTRYGKLRGISVEFAGLSLPAVEAFLGVEYGSLLGGALRFMPPTGPVEKWRGLRLANAFKPVCPQRGLDAAAAADELPAARAERLRNIEPFVQTESEECLFLNIYVPAEASGNDERLPVMVFIHGESYDFGTGNAYDGSVLASVGNVVVITLNYRLGPLGFLGGTDDINGNYAVFDIIAALHWIKANIEDFGGDGERVTLFGQGYGAALAHLLTLTPVASGKRAVAGSARPGSSAAAAASATSSLTTAPAAAAAAAGADANPRLSGASTDAGMRLFHRIIMQSGSLLCSWAVSNSRSQVDDVAAALNCTGGGDGGETVLGCLKKASAKALMNAAVPSQKYTSVFGPTIDGRTVLPRQPIALQSWTAVDSPGGGGAGGGAPFGKVEMLLGIGRFEGLLYFGQRLLEGGVSAARRKSILRAYVRSMYENNRQEIYDILMHQYSDWDAPLPLGGGGVSDAAGAGDEWDESAKRMLVELLGDGQYNVPVVRTALAHAAHHDTFLYVFGHSAEQDRFPEWSGGAHGEDLAFVFGAPLGDAVSPFANGAAAAYTRNERLLSEAVIRMWSNFAKTGNPNFPVASEAEIERNRFLETFWPKYEPRRQEYLYLGMRPTVNHHYRGDMISIWLDLIPKVHHTDRLAPSHQLLRDRDNASAKVDAAAVAVGSRTIERWNIVLPPPPSPPPPPFRTFFSANILPSSPAISTAAFVSPTGDPDSEPTAQGVATSSTAPSSTAASPEKEPEVREQTAGPSATTSQSARTPVANYTDVVARDSKDGSDARGESGGGVGLPLTITIGVGCALLFINAFIFVGVYFQKNKMRQERQALKAAAAAAAATPSAESDKPLHGGGGGGRGDGEALNVSSDQLSLTARTNAIFEAYSRTKEAAAREERNKKAAELDEQVRARQQPQSPQPGATAGTSRHDRNAAAAQRAAAVAAGFGGGGRGEAESRRSSGSSCGRGGGGHLPRSDESDGDRRPGYAAMNGHSYASAASSGGERTPGAVRQREHPQFPPHEGGVDNGFGRGRGGGYGQSPSPPPTPSSGRHPTPRERLTRTPTPRARNRAAHSSADAAPVAAHSQRYSDADGARSRDPRTCNGAEHAGEHDRMLPARHGSRPAEHGHYAEHPEPSSPQSWAAPQRRPPRRESDDGCGDRRRIYDDELPLSDDSYSGDSRGRTPREVVHHRGVAPDHNGRAHYYAERQPPPPEQQQHWSLDGPPARRSQSASGVAHGIRKVPGLQQQPVDHAPHRNPHQDFYSDETRSKVYGDRDIRPDDGHWLPAETRERQHRNSRRDERLREPHARYHEGSIDRDISTGPRPRYNAGQYEH